MTKLSFNKKTNVTPKLVHDQELWAEDVNEMMDLLEELYTSMLNFQNAQAVQTFAEAWPVGGMKVRGYATNYPILDQFYNAVPKTVEHAAAPTTAGWGRIDAVVADVQGEVLIIQGDAGAVFTEPTVDATTHYLIRYFLILANATSPVDPVTVTGPSVAIVAYRENLGDAGGEANASSNNATINVNSPNFLIGAKSIEATLPQKQHKAQFAWPVMQSTVGISHLQYILELKAIVDPAKYWFIGLLKDGKRISNSWFLFKNGQYGFNASSLTEQTILIPIEATPFQNAYFNGMEIFFYHGSNTIPGYFMDNIEFLNGISTNPNIPETTDYKLYASGDARIGLYKNLVLNSEIDLRTAVQPNHLAFISQAAMIANQNIQRKDYQYFDGTSTWQYLGTTLGTIADYRIIGGSGGGSGDMLASNNLSEVDPATARTNLGIATAKTKTDFLIITQAVDLDDIEIRVNNLDAAVVLKGAWDASAGTFPGAGIAQAGFSYQVTVAGTVNGIDFSINDRIIALVDNASTTVYATNWLKADYSDLVASFNGRTGAIVLLNTDVSDLIVASTDKTTLVDTDIFSLFDTVLKKVTWANLKATLKTYFDTIYQPIGAGGGTGDMVLADVQTVSGEKTFLNLKFGLRNVANTFTSFFTNANTAVRTYTLPNKSMTIAGTDDVALKQNLIAGTVNRILKNVGTNLFGDSRLWDTGNFFGIDVINAPTKEITLGNQSNKEIGIEQSESTVVGRDLIVSAGRTVNFSISTTLQALGIGISNTYSIISDSNNDIYLITFNQGIYKRTNGIGSFTTWTTTGLTPSLNGGGCFAPNGDMYLAGTDGNIYKATGGSSVFSNLGLVSINIYSMCATPNGDVYAAVGKDGNRGGSTGDIYKQTGGVGAFNALGFSARYYKICSVPNGDVYAVAFGGGVYKISSGTTVLTDLLQTARNWSGIYAATSGDLYAVVYGGDLYTSTGGSFTATSQTFRNFGTVNITVNNILYASGWQIDVYTMNIASLGTANLDGGTLKHKAGTGKGTGKSRLEFITGQKTASGTDMQLETLREYIDENGYHIYISIPIYANDAAADADANLPSGASYKLTGNRTIFHKP